MSGGGAGAATVGTAAGPGTLRRVCLMYPDRGTGRQRSSERELVWRDYEEVGAELGLEVLLATPENVSVDGLSPQSPLVYLDGKSVTPADTLFVTELHALPYMLPDVVNQVALYTLLEQVGFHLPLPPRLSYLANDTMAALLHLADSPVPPVPTVRITTGREVGHRLHERAWADLPFPAIVKPASWGAGWGITRVGNLEDLRAVAGLAAGSETALVCQPYLGDDTSDYRVYVVEGRAHTVLRRSPRCSGYVANGGRGGRKEYVPIPEELAAAVPYFAAKFPVPYFCVDFLFDGSQFWLSQLEPDGAIACPDRDSPEAVRTHRTLLADRFRAYQRAHARRQQERA
ncbi:hypothetical protein GCM10009665_64140 [Kitasatospora nipponensis]|uniref:ATP-grasp domain-containing protein n=1 Tax=Kitasatospora nipponensis TaxID=258049 RepID=A0ABN1WWM3_9ACTN